MKILDFKIVKMILKIQMEKMDFKIIGFRAHDDLVWEDIK